MAFPTSRQTDSAERVAEQIDSVVSRTVDLIQRTRTSVDANQTITGNQLFELYSQVSSVITFVNSKGGASGINEAYKRRFTALPSGFSAATEWTSTARPALISLRVWLANNIPKASGNRPAFHQINAQGELESYRLPVEGATKTAFLAECDAVLAAFS